ncbi:MAG: hypothetical protein WEE89_21555 [Gemmatimonadota bacterium]
MRASILISTLFVVANVAGVAAQDSDDAWLRRCERDNWNDRESHCVVRVSGFRPSRGTFSFDPGANGGVRVEGWNRDSVAVHARIRGSADDVADARALAGDVRIERSGNSVRAEVPGTERRESISVELVVYLPMRSDLDIETLNGPLSVYNVQGQLSLATRNGPLSLEAVGGDVQARTQNGPLTVSLSGNRWRGAGLDAEAVNGPVTLMIPRSYNAELETGTQNGPVDIDFPVTVTVIGRMTRQINTTLGSGGPPIRVVTKNGPLRLTRL